MDQYPPTVYIVLDPSYGDRLHDLPPGTPAWIVDTPTNKAAATGRIERHPEEDQFTGVTTFKPDGESPAEWCLNVLDIVEEHHPRFRELRVIGTSINEDLRAALAVIGMTRTEATESGFTAFGQSGLRYRR